MTDLVYDYVSQEPTFGRTRNFKKGAFVWQTGTVEHAVYFLKRGQVAVLLSDAGGSEVILRMVEAGELFGELCFCSKLHEARDQCAQALMDCESLEIDYAEFMAFLRKPHALETFTFSLCQRLADAHDRVEVLSHRGAEARLGRLLLQLAKSRPASSQVMLGSDVKIPLGHDDLARMAAMTRPHVSVTMGKLRALGVLNYDRGRQLTIHTQRLLEYLELPDRTVCE